MGLTIEDCIHKLDFSIKAYQKLIDEHVSDGQVVGTGVRGEWSANTPLNEAYQSHIDAYKMAIETVRKYQKIEEIVSSKTTRLSYEDGFRQIKEVVENGNNRA